MFVSRAICAILLVLKLSFQNCPTFKQRFGAPPKMAAMSKTSFTKISGWNPLCDV